MARAVWLSTWQGGLGALATALILLTTSCSSEPTLPPRDAARERRADPALLARDFDQDVYGLEVMLLQPLDGDMRARLRATLSPLLLRLDADPEISDQAYRKLLNARIDALSSDRGGADVGDPTVYTAMVARLDAEIDRLRGELRALMHETAGRHAPAE